jgi:hypothetical protein
MRPSERRNKDARISSLSNGAREDTPPRRLPQLQLYPESELRQSHERDVDDNFADCAAPTGLKGSFWSSSPRYHPKKQRPFLGDPGEAWGLATVAPPARRETRARLINKSHLQNCLLLADKRQGTTLVVPEMVHSDSGFSRCLDANK